MLVANLEVSSFSVGTHYYGTLIYDDPQTGELVRRELTYVLDEGDARNLNRADTHGFTYKAGTTSGRFTGLDKLYEAGVEAARSVSPDVLIVEGMYGAYSAIKKILYAPPGDPRVARLRELHAQAVEIGGYKRRGDNGEMYRIDDEWADILHALENGRG